MINKLNYKSIKKQLKKTNTVAIFSHSKPDPDTVGTTLALKLVLERMGKSVDIFCDDEMQQNFSEVFEELEDYNKQRFDVYDLAISVDVAREDFLKKHIEIFKSAKLNVNFDHHKDNENFAKINVIKEYSSCSLFLFTVLQDLKIKITPKIATYLYLGMVADTGYFRYTNTDSKTLFYASKLIEIGVDIEKVVNTFYCNRTLSSMLLLNRAVSSIKYNIEKGFAVAVLKKKDADECGIEKLENVSFMANYILDCKEFYLTAIISEREDGNYCSFRSSKGYDCSKIAHIFNGGGHTGASACSSTKNIDEFVEDIYKAMEENIEKIKQD